VGLEVIEEGACIEDGFAEIGGGCLGLLVAIAVAFDSWVFCSFVEFAQYHFGVFFVLIHDFGSNLNC
jgi:hypothetical protein